MQDWVIDDQNLSPERKSLLPGKGFFIPDTVEDEVKEREIESRVSGASVLAVVDPDADGLGCVAILRDVLGEAAFIPASPHELADGIEQAAEFGEAGGEVFICDLAPDDPEEINEALAGLTEHAGSVTWYDHHQWTDAAKEAVRDAGVELVVGDSETECTADVAARSLDEDISPHLEELAAVTRDHDLWIKEDDRSDDLADFSHWSEPEEYLEVIEEHGVDFPEEVREFLAERRVEKEDRIERAVARAEMHEIRDWTVGVTYGRCSQNEVAETLREQGADAAVIVKPAGSASIRGSEDFERAHEVARQVGGGGHPRAAGCKPRIYEDMLDYAHHWTTRGAPAKQLLMKAFWNLPEEPAEE
ncbi:DHH family phosphoesterase [Halodesulfurarchaeum formicicum]|uniref:Recombinase RecJ n=1 Tax=Halodesulfurarchaeum formicicum TaxID=1873524 RepID=A0A1J1AEH5_9EURY|nr:recombinase RecJ [Halodesulfurarchaeum formicicum]APE96152.1 recombinase RecJ [Halodesulfurarchaeum formicicum]